MNEAWKLVDARGKLLGVFPSRNEALAEWQDKYFMPFPTGIGVYPATPEDIAGAPKLYERCSIEAGQRVLQPIPGEPGKWRLVELHREATGDLIGIVTANLALPDEAG